MDKHYVKTELEGLKSSSSTRVQETLLNIRSKVITNDDGIKLFTECGGLNCLVPLLQKTNERILDLALSILGNCCLNSECRLEVSKLQYVPPLMTLLTTVYRDSIVGRTCRVVGNLAQNHSNAEDFHNHGAVLALVNVIRSRDKNTSYPTLTMAVRALRQLWIVKDKRKEMLSVNTVFSIATLLITECESAGILKSENPQHEPSELRKSQGDLISGILRSLGYFTTHATAECAKQIEADGRGFECLVVLTKPCESLALQCLFNLCFLGRYRPMLGAAGLVKCIIALIQKSSRSTEACCWSEGSARALSQLCDDSVNRARIRRAGGLPLLLTAAREHTFALRALLQFVFDDTSFQVLVKEGIIILLTDDLKKHVLTMESAHEYKESVKENNSKDTPNKSQNEAQHDKDLNKEKSGLFKRRQCSSDEEGLNVVIKRDNMVIGFNETLDSDASETHIEDEERSFPQRQRKRLQRSRSKSPSSFMKRTRMWGADLYWEVKNERDGTCRSPMSVEAASMSPLSPCSESAAGFSPEYRSSGRSDRCEWSPESGFSTGEGSSASPNWTEYQWSPGSTSPFSVVNEDSSNSEISGRYSPVCSEHEDEVEETDTEQFGKGLEATQAALDLLLMTDLVKQDDDEPYEMCKKKSFYDYHSSRIACVMVLLYRVTNGAYGRYNQKKKPPNIPTNMLDILTSKDSLNALLDFVEKCRRPTGRGGSILSLICGNYFCLLNILKHKIPLRLYKMYTTTKHPENNCLQCKQLKKLSGKLMDALTVQAETSYGIGVISYQLFRGSDCMKETLALVLPYIVKSKAILRKYYIECQALNVLFAAVPETNEEMEHYVTAIGKLSTNVQIKDPKLLENNFLDQVPVSYDPILDSIPDSEIVTFELDDMSTVKANRTFLCQNSEVFSAMLMGCFKESIEESVKIKNVTKDGLEYLFTLLHCGLNNTKNDVLNIPMANQLETNLEVLILADRFLFEKLKVSLNSAILQFKMLPDTADKIYAWSLSEGMGFLCVESVAYLLTGEMCDKDRSQAFRNILNLEYRDQWIDDIKSIITRELKRW